jgi:hypothetical protein
MPLKVEATALTWKRKQKILVVWWSERRTGKFMPPDQRPCRLAAMAGIGTAPGLFTAGSGTVRMRMLRFGRLGG